MGSISEKLWANMASFPSQLSAEVRERESFKEQLQAVFDKQPVNWSELDSILSCELDRMSAVMHSRKLMLQVLLTFTLLMVHVVFLSVSKRSRNSQEYVPVNLQPDVCRMVCRCINLYCSDTAGVCNVV